MSSTHKHQHRGLVLIDVGKLLLVLLVCTPSLAGASSALWGTGLAYDGARVPVGNYDSHWKYRILGPGDLANPAWLPAFVDTPSPFWRGSDGSETYVFPQAGPHVNNCPSDLKWEMQTVVDLRGVDLATGVSFSTWADDAVGNISVQTSPRKTIFLRKVRWEDRVPPADAYTISARTVPGLQSNAVVNLTIGGWNWVGGGWNLCGFILYEAGPCSPKLFSLTAATGTSLKYAFKCSTGKATDGLQLSCFDGTTLVDGTVSNNYTAHVDGLTAGKKYVCELRSCKTGLTCVVLQTAESSTTNYEPCSPAQFSPTSATGTSLRYTFKCSTGTVTDWLDLACSDGKSLVGGRITANYTALVEGLNPGTKIWCEMCSWKIDACSVKWKAVSSTIPACAPSDLRPTRRSGTVLSFVWSCPVNTWAGAWSMTCRGAQGNTITAAAANSDRSITVLKALRSTIYTCTLRTCPSSGCATVWSAVTVKTNTSESTSRASGRNIVTMDGGLITYEACGDYDAVTSKSGRLAVQTRNCPRTASVCGAAVQCSANALLEVFPAETGLSYRWNRAAVSLPAGTVLNATGAVVSTGSSSVLIRCASTAVVKIISQVPSARGLLLDVYPRGTSDARGLHGNPTGRIDDDVQSRDGTVYKVLATSASASVVASRDRTLLATLASWKVLPGTSLFSVSADSSSSCS